MVPTELCYNKTMGICIKDNCNKNIASRDMCKGHYSSWWASKNRKRIPEYYVYSDMKQRCYNKNHKSYHRYGGRNIGVSADWLKSFDNFYADMGKRPANMSIDRIDNEKGYSKENCRWADTFTQRQNQSKSVRNSSGSIGVSYNTASKKWVAKATRYKNFYWFGRYNTKTEAEQAYKDGINGI